MPDFVALMPHCPAWHRTGMPCRRQRVDVVVVGVPFESLYFMVAAAGVLATATAWCTGIEALLSTAMTITALPSWPPP